MESDSDVNDDDDMKTDSSSAESSNSKIGRFVAME